MKKHVLFIALLSAATNLNAQSFPNGGFENWTSQMIYEDPEYWTSLNMLILFGAEETAVKTTEAHSGTYALKLSTSVSDMGDDGEMDTIPGILSLGTADIMNGTGTAGYPFTQKPDSLVGWYKLISPDNIPFHLQFSSTQWDSGSESPETVASAYFEGQASSDYTRFSIPITYFNNGTPDSIQVFIMNAIDGSAVANELYLDDLSFIYNSTAGVEEQTAHVRMYPNPATDLLMLQSDKPVQQLVVKDMNGKQLFETSNAGDNYRLDLHTFAEGIYFCELQFKDGSSKRMKFIKQ